MAHKQLKWQQIFGEMEARIHSGQLRGKLPSYPRLSEEFGTSIITISRVIRELERRGLVVVKPKSGVTVEPVAESASESTPAARLSGAVIKRIALVLPVAIADPYWGRLADGALSACWQRNQQGRTRWRLELNYSVAPLAHHDLYVENVGDVVGSLTAQERERAEEREKQVILDLSEEVEGLMIAPRFVFAAHFYTSLLKRGTRILTVDNKILGTPCVASHNRRAAYKGIAFLLLGKESDRGRVLRRVGNGHQHNTLLQLDKHAPQLYVIGEFPQANTMRDRVLGCQEAMQDAVLAGYRSPLNWLRILEPVKNLSDYQVEAYQTTAKLIRELEMRGRPGSQNFNSIVAIFALTDRCALGAFQALQERGYTQWNSEKESVALLSYDNLWQSLAAHSISSLAQDPFEMGKRGAELLLDMPHPSTFSQPGGSMEDVWLEVGLVQRDSTRGILAS